MCVAKVGTVVHWHIAVFDALNAPVTGLVSGDFTKLLVKDGATTAEALTVTEVDAGTRPGIYDITYTPLTEAEYYANVRHATHNPRGWDESWEVTDDGVPSVLDIVDTLLKRGASNVEAAADLHSLASVILKLTSKFDSVLGITYRSDGVTPHMTQAITHDPLAEPITMIGDAV